MLKRVGRAEEIFIVEIIKSSPSYGNYYNTIMKTGH
jgi:hypothetical protein